MQPAVHATRRTPGPSTVDPVVKEWRNPTSPLARAARTAASGTSLPRPTRSSYGLSAASDFPPPGSSGNGRAPVEGPVDHVHLLLAREPHEVHRVARDAARRARVLLGVLRCVQQ